MKYMMFVCTDTEPETDESRVPDIEVWVAENDAAGRRVTGNVLAPPSAATTVRVRGGELLLTDGPFAETKEVIVGFDILECADLDEALAVVAADLRHACLTILRAQGALTGPIRSLPSAIQVITPFNAPAFEENSRVVVRIRSGRSSPW